MKTERNYAKEAEVLLRTLAIKLDLLPAAKPEEIFKTLLDSVKREGADKLREYVYNTDFLTAPASTRFHGNVKGGLVTHSILVYILLSAKNKQYHLGLDQESVVLCALLHDLCKANFYTVEYKNKKIYSENGKKSDAAGRFDWESVPGYSVNDQFPLGHAEKSMSLIQDFVKLSDTEKLLIRWHMGPFGAAQGDQYGFNNATAFEPACCAMYTADLEASALFEEIKE